MRSRILPLAWVCGQALRQIAVECIVSGVLFTFKNSIMFQYPNQNEVLSRNTELSQMESEVGKQIRFTLYDKKGFPNGENVGKITSVQYPDYIATVGKKKFLVSKDDYINIF